MQRVCIAHTSLRAKRRGVLLGLTSFELFAFLRGEKILLCNLANCGFLGGLSSKWVANMCEENVRFGNYVKNVDRVISQVFCSYRIAMWRRIPRFSVLSSNQQLTVFANDQYSNVGAAWISAKLYFSILRE